MLKIYNIKDKCLKLGGSMKIAMACDHSGYERKIELKKMLKEEGYEVIDFGTNNENNCDLPDYIYPAALSVANNETEFGIFIDGLGYGSAIIANKIKGVYAAVCNEIFSASLDRTYANSNVICLGGKIINSELSKKIIKTWLSSEIIDDNERYLLRKEKVEKIEKIHFK